VGSKILMYIYGQQTQGTSIINRLKYTDTVPKDLT
jgi:hypothetical protein